MKKCQISTCKADKRKNSNLCAFHSQQVKILQSAINDSLQFCCKKCRQPIPLTEMTVHGYCSTCEPNGQQLIDLEVAGHVQLPLPFPPILLPRHQVTEVDQHRA